MPPQPCDSPSDYRHISRILPKVGPQEPGPKAGPKMENVLASPGLKSVAWGVAASLPLRGLTLAFLALGGIIGRLASLARAAAIAVASGSTASSIPGPPP